MHEGVPTAITYYHSIILFCGMLPSDSDSLTCILLVAVWTVGLSLLEAGLFLRDDAAEGNTDSFDAMFNRSLAICLTSSIRSIHFFALLKQ